MSDTTPLPPLPERDAQEVAAELDQPKQRRTVTLPRWSLFAAAGAGVLLLVGGAALGVAIQYNKLAPEVVALSSSTTTLKGQLDSANRDLKLSNDQRDMAVAQADDLQARADEINQQSSTNAARKRELDERAKSVAARERAVKAAEGKLNASSFDDGTFRVGKDIKPGTYRTSGADGCYWARLSSGGGTVYDIIANNNTDGPTTVVISSGDWGFESSDCGTWHKVD